MFVVLDTETTGLHPYRGHEMISFAGIKLNEDLEEIGRLHIHIWPQNINKADPQSLKINGYSSAQWARLNALDPRRAATEIAGFMGSCIPVAHNWSFDRGFILKLLQDHAPERKIMRRGIDTIALASAALMPFGVKSMSMSSIAKLFGWPEQTHEALDDVLMCAQLFRLCYPLSARNAIKVRLLLYRARIALYLNPLRGK